MGPSKDERLRRLEVELRELRCLLRETVRRARRAEDLLQSLKRSRRYRLGNTLVSAVAEPRRLLDLAGSMIDRLRSFVARTGGLDSHGEGEGLRLLVAGHDLRFFDPVGRTIQAAGATVRFDRWAGEHTHDIRRSLGLLAWADAVVAEWCLGNAVWYSRHKRPHQRLVVRFHLRERASAYPQRVDWDAVDRVVFVGPTSRPRLASSSACPKKRRSGSPTW